jgi:hypothetical protein
VAGEEVLRDTLDRIPERDNKAAAVTQGQALAMTVLAISGSPAAQFEAIIATCRDLDRQDRADRLMQLTLQPA